MRKLFFLLPGTTRQFYCGGLFAELQTLQLASQLCDASVATYRQREDNVPFLDDLLQQPTLDRYIFVISWGFDVPRLMQRLHHCHVVYHAHSSGYGFRIPARVPIITVSRNTMGYWGHRSPQNLIYLLPNCLADTVENRQTSRDVDVLVQARKSSEYVLQQLVPALQQHCRLVVIDTFVDDLIDLFNRTKIYLYDSAEYWAQHRLTEGFGLPPLEALACGCQVFSSVNHALADYLDPGMNCHKIAGYATEYDQHRVLKCLQNWQPNALPDDFFAPYRTPQLLPRLTMILEALNEFYDYAHDHRSDIPELTRSRQLRLFIQQASAKLQAKLRAQLRTKQ